MWHVHPDHTRFRTCVWAGCGGQFVRWQFVKWQRRSVRWMREDKGEVRPRLKGGTEVERGNQVEKEEEDNRGEGVNAGLNGTGRRRSSGRAGTEAALRLSTCGPATLTWVVKSGLQRCKCRLHTSAFSSRNPQEFPALEYGNASPHALAPVSRSGSGGGLSFVVMLLSVCPTSYRGLACLELASGKCDS
jgi:hypothetical protein